MTASWWLSTLVFVVLGLFFAVSFVLFPLAIYFQEKRCFVRVSIVRVFLFTQLWITLSYLEVFKLIFHKVMGSDIERRAHYACMKVAAQTFSIFFGAVNIEGAEYLPKDDEAVVYVANHQSMMDVGLFFHVNTLYSWVSKDTVFLVPGAGRLMTWAGYIPLKRRNRSSVGQMFDAAQAKLKSGVSLIVFPQGTRNRTKVLPFKDGAFQMAVSGDVAVVPVSLILPQNLWTHRGGAARIIIHPRVAPPPNQLGDEAARVAVMRDAAFAALMPAVLAAAEAEDSGGRTASRTKED